MLSFTGGRFSGVIYVRSLGLGKLFDRFPIKRDSPHPTLYSITEISLCRKLAAIGLWRLLLCLGFWSVHISFMVFCVYAVVLIFSFNLASGEVSSLEKWTEWCGGRENKYIS